MRIALFLLILYMCFPVDGKTQTNQKESILTKDQLLFLEQLTRDVLEASRIYPGQFISNEFGTNKTGGTLIRPGGRNAYPSFWIRDYAMSLETGFISVAEQKHMLELTASTQCDQAWITKGGSLVPVGSVADHIRIDDGKPIYFPGTYDFENQGTPEFGTLPPFCDQFFFIHMAHYYVAQSRDRKILKKEINGKRLIDRLKAAFHMPPSNVKTHMVYATEKMRGVDFGFRDVQTITGDLSFASILKYRAANELADLLELVQSQEAMQYRKMAEKIKTYLPGIFSDKRGMLLASTGRSAQPDVWATALAVHLSLLEGDAAMSVSKLFVDAYKAGSLSYKGNIRHILTTDDFNENTAWEISLSPKNLYQNGAYWGTPTGWVVNAIKLSDPGAATALAREYIAELIENDFRKGETFGAPYECFNPSGYNQNPVYLTSVACPLVVFRKL
ncbi:hypothetical protein [Flavihumibacter cheonanensis]|uniref:hypothetical protein n=1 Tax=Flavihumibacter cheonanensis TaxID=1442385 RepID=UPI001EF8272B|nr:hypothetical protein [Flavihumibacter cheonanensis]MCG7754116.1 hypothetical protein [Flavihumibacter cheonanensis]